MIVISVIGRVVGYCLGDCIITGSISIGDIVGVASIGSIVISTTCYALV